MRAPKTIMATKEISVKKYVVRLSGEERAVGGLGLRPGPRGLPKCLTVRRLRDVASALECLVVYHRGSFGLRV
jgi:hypothetical protein